MRHTQIRTVVLGVAATLLTASSVVAQEATGYLTPPQAIVDILDAPRTPQVVVSPTGDTIALLSRPAMPPIAELAQPMLRLAGYRLNPRTNGPHTTAGGSRITITRIDDGAERAFDAPPETSLGGVEFSPDGSRLIFMLTRYNGIEVWLMDVATGQARPLSDTSVNATWGNPCDWLDQNATVVCRFKASARGAPPAAPDIPAGPNIQEHQGGAAPIRTYQDLLQNAHDEALFEYYFTSQVATIELATGRRTAIGRPGLYERVSASPSGQYFLMVEVEQPFSWLVTARSFPKDVTIRNGSGEIVASIARLPLADAVPIGGVPTGPRSYTWNPTEPHTLVWVEAQDGGDPRRTVPHRDRVLTFTAPFGGDPTELARTEFRFGGIAWTEDGTALLTERDRPTRWTRTWVLDGNAEPRKLWDRSSEDRYANPGGPVTERLPGGRVIRQTGSAIYLTGAGASPEGDRPFLDRLDLRTFETERLFQSADDAYEVVVAMLSDDGGSVLTRRETRLDPPNYYVRDTPNGGTRAITSFQDPAPQVTGIEKELVTYQRADGVQLSGTLYLPPGYREDQKVPMVMWAYPREFVDPRLAGQVSGSDNRFTTIRGASHLLLLTQGFGHLRRTDTADHRLGRDRQQHLHRAARGGCPGGRGQGGRDRGDRPRHDRCRGAQLRRVHDGQPAGSLRPVPDGHRPQRRLQPVVDAVRVPERAPHVLGGHRHLRRDVTFLPRRQDQRTDPADPRGGRQQLRDVSDPVGPDVHGAQGPRRHRSIRDVAARVARLRLARVGAAHGGRDAELGEQGT